MTGRVAAGEFVGTGREQKIPATARRSVPSVSRPVVLGERLVREAHGSQAPPRAPVRRRACRAHCGARRPRARRPGRRPAPRSRGMDRARLPVQACRDGSRASAPADRLGRDSETALDPRRRAHAPRRGCRCRRGRSRSAREMAPPVGKRVARVAGASHMRSSMPSRARRSRARRSRPAGRRCPRSG